MKSILDILNIPFGYTMRAFNFITGGNYLLSLILFALAMKLILIPFAIKQQKSQIKGARLRPKLAAIEKKYAGRNDRATMQKKNEEIMLLQQKEGYSPLSGCGPLLLQFPILIALYNVVREPLTYVCRFSSENIVKIKEIIAAINPAIEFTKKSTEIDVIREMRAVGLEHFDFVRTDLIPRMTVFGNGFDLSKTPSFTSWLILIPILTFVSYYFSMKISRNLTSAGQPVQQDPQTAASMKIMDFSMPLISVFFTFSLPAAIGAYWIFQSVFSLLQTYILVKVMPFPTFTEEEYAAAEREYKCKNKGNDRSVIGTSENAGKVRSLHHIDDDDDIPELEHHASDDEETPDAIPEGERTAGVESAPMKQDEHRETKKKKKNK